MQMLSDKQKIEVVEKYENGCSSVKLAKEYNVTANAILGILKRRGVKIKNNKDYKI